MPAEIIYSRDETLYYITDGENRPRYWLEVKEREGEPTQEEKDKMSGIFSGGGSQFKLPDGRRYWKKLYSFSFFDVKSGKREPIDRKSDLYLDFASLHANDGGWVVPEDGKEHTPRADKLRADLRACVASVPPETCLQGQDAVLDAVVDALLARFRIEERTF